MQPVLAATALPRRDKVVSLLDKIRNIRHGNPLGVSAALGTYLNGIKPARSAWLACVDAAGNKSGNLCVDGCLSSKMRFCATSPFPGLPS